MVYTLENPPKEGQQCRFCFVRPDTHASSTSSETFNHQNRQDWRMLMAGLVFSEDDEGRQEASNKLAEMNAYFSEFLRKRK